MVPNLTTEVHQSPVADKSRLDGVAVFVAVAEAGGFARAAQRLTLTRSAVAKAVARLEARLGVRLFHRTTRSQSLTEDGQVYLERCLRALEELRQAETLLTSEQQEVSGRLRIALPVLFGRRCVAPILLELARSYPALELDLRFSDRVADLVGEGFDLAIRNGNPGSMAGLRTRKVATQAKVICAAPAYLAIHGEPVRMDDLARYEMLVYRWNDETYPQRLPDTDDGMPNPPLRWRLRFDDYEALADAAVGGLGLAWLPKWLVDDHMTAGNLVSVLHSYRSAPLDTYAVWPDRRFLPRRLRVVIDALAASLPAKVG